MFQTNKKNTNLETISDKIQIEYLFKMISKL